MQLVSTVFVICCDAYMNITMNSFIGITRKRAPFLGGRLTSSTRAARGATRSELHSRTLFPIRRASIYEHAVCCFSLFFVDLNTENEISYETRVQITISFYGCTSLVEIFKTRSHVDMFRRTFFLHYLECVGCTTCLDSHCLFPVFSSLFLMYCLGWGGALSSVGQCTAFGWAVHCLHCHRLGSALPALPSVGQCIAFRSEERRVGKECLL